VRVDAVSDVERWESELVWLEALAGEVESARPWRL
jgi:hypothetical protein